MSLKATLVVYIFRSKIGGFLKMNLLVVKANNRPDGVSTKMYETFMGSVKDVKNFKRDSVQYF